LTEVRREREVRSLRIFQSCGLLQSAAALGRDLLGRVLSLLVITLATTDPSLTPAPPVLRFRRSIDARTLVTLGKRGLHARGRLEEPIPALVRQARGGPERTPQS